MKLIKISLLSELSLSSALIMVEGGKTSQIACVGNKNLTFGFSTNSNKMVASFKYRS